jgi:hypothetical protein
MWWLRMTTADLVITCTGAPDRLSRQVEAALASDDRPLAILDLAPARHRSRGAELPG